jgi:hypothetical protein
MQFCQLLLIACPLKIKDKEFILLVIFLVKHDKLSGHFRKRNVWKDGKGKGKVVLRRYNAVHQTQLIPKTCFNFFPI